MFLSAQCIIFLHINSCHFSHLLRKSLNTSCLASSFLRHSGQLPLFMLLLIPLILQILAFIQVMHSSHFWNSIWYILPYFTKKLTLYCWDQQRSSCLIQTQLPLLGMLQAFCKHMQIHPFSFCFQHNTWQMLITVITKVLNI
jgi:hypothetical protein